MVFNCDSSAIKIDMGTLWSSEEDSNVPLCNTPNISVRLQMKYILCYWIKQNKLASLHQIPHEIINLICRFTHQRSFDTESLNRCRIPSNCGCVPLKKYELTDYDIKNNRKGQDYIVKVVIIGDSSVGKTSMLRRFIDKTFSLNDQMATIGMDLQVKILWINDIKLKLVIWDTPGGYYYRGRIPSYFLRGAAGVIMVYDIMNRDSLAHIKTIWNEWMTDEHNAIPKHANHHIEKILVGNKLDLVQDNRGIVKIST